MPKLTESPDALLPPEFGQPAMREERPSSNPVEAYAYFEDDHWWFAARRQIVRRAVRSLMRPSAERLVIDVGCGPGGNLAELCSMYQCLGIDSSEAAVALARERFPSIEFVCGVAPGDIAEKAERADLWLLMDVLEHVEADRDLLHSLVAAAKPGSHFLITVPADPILWSPHDDAAGHWRRYTQPTLRALWQHLPVREKLVSGYNAHLYWPVRAVRALTSRRGRSHGGGHSEGLDLRLPPPPLNALLRGLFTHESVRLAQAVNDPKRAFGRGVSLIAILERLPGTVDRQPQPVSASAFTPPELAS